MKILNSTTNEVFEIVMIDPKSGCDWANDYVFNAISKDEYTDPTDEQLEQFPAIVAVMDGDIAGWWISQCEEMAKADEVLFSKRAEICASDECGECNQFDEDFHQYIGGFDFNDTPNAIISFCESFVSYEN